MTEKTNQEPTATGNETSEFTETEQNQSSSSNRLVDGEGDRSELIAMQDKYLRLAADFENFKRNARRDREEMRQTAGREIIVDLLEVLDDCDRAEKQILALDASEQKNFEGTLLVFNKLRRVLMQKGVKPLECVDAEFDVEKHEAIMQVDAAEDKKGKVMEELIKGYFLNDKLIRFAKVVVGK
jgi:molecular chaperone GrpE